MKQQYKELSKYSSEQIEYAIKYWTKRNGETPTIMWVLGNMETPCSLLSAEKQASKQKGTRIERNKKRVIRNSKAECRTQYPEYLFTDARQNNRS